MRGFQEESQIFSQTKLCLSSVVNGLTKVRNGNNHLWVNTVTLKFLKRLFDSICPTGCRLHLASSQDES